MRGSTGINGAEVSGVWVSALAAFTATFFYPITRRGRDHRRQTKLMRLWFTGADGVNGVSPTIIPAPVQLAKVQEDVAVILDRVESILQIVSPDQSH